MAQFIPRDYMVNRGHYLSESAGPDKTNKVGKRPDELSKRAPEMAEEKMTICNNRYTVYKKRLLGEGSFGRVYLGKANDSRAVVAIKSEEPKYNYLTKEANIYKILTGGSTPPIGFSRFHWFGEDADGNKYLVCEPLGKSIQDLFVKCGNHFSLKTIIMLAYQMINRMEYLHSKGYIHRDIKPANFLIGIGEKQNTVYMVDFGLSKEYTTPEGEHIENPKNRGKSYVGTIRYMSINCHKCAETSRRDDMMSFIYMLYFFYFGNLPWQGITDPDKKKRLRMIQTMKSEFNRDPQRFYKTPVPSCLLNIMDYIRKIRFKQPIDYDRIRSAIYDDMTANGYQNDYQWDWLKAE